MANNQHCAPMVSVLSTTTPAKIWPGSVHLIPATGLNLRFTRFAEDNRPSWSPDGNRFAFGSNREGDRRWRIYVAWADVDGEANNINFGENPAWHPNADTIVFRGCDETGNRCGLWTMTGAGSGRSSLTSVPEDTMPAWSPGWSLRCLHQQRPPWKLRRLPRRHRERRRRAPHR